MPGLLATTLSLALAASPFPSPAAEPLTLALIVASNRAAGLARPPLQYADDDGARYHVLFSAVAAPGDAVLLADLDADSARLFPDQAAVASPPTRAGVLAAAGRLARQAAEARAADRPVRFYFVFAGHGDVVGGRGVLELADGPFDSEDLASLLRWVGAGESHVLLDSCNAFFVINPRKPGGQRFATPRGAAAHLARRLPGVGVFLSTSAEAEVYEWSELQSGVFSHAVRSGLLGGADADGDGRVTYDELAAFVETAAAGIKNPLYRPRVFSRGPDGRSDRTFLDLGSARGPVVTLPAGEPLRLAARDADGLRWADVFTEPGGAVRLWFPASLAGRMELERRSTGDGPATVQARWRVVGGEGGAAVQLDGLPPAGPSAATRGDGEIFRALFTRPYGPAALVAWRAVQAGAPEQVYGVSRQDAERMGRLLDQLAASERERRQVRGAAAMAIGLGAGSFLATEAPAGPAPKRTTALALAGGLAAAGVGLGVHDWLTASAGERVQRRFAGALADPEADQARAVAEADAGLRAILEREADVRLAPLALGAGLAVYGGAMLLAPDRLSDHPTPDSRRATRYAGALQGAVGLTLFVGTWLADNPTEKIIAIWSTEPATRQRPDLSLSPVPVPGGGVLALSGTF